MDVRVVRAEEVQGPRDASHVEYEFGVYASAASSQSCHTIRGRYSALRSAYLRLPASVPGCIAKFPDKRLVQDGVFKERRGQSGIDARTHALREFFAALLGNDASEAVNVRLHKQMGIPEAASRTLCAALAARPRPRPSAAVYENQRCGGASASSLFATPSIGAFAASKLTSLDRGPWTDGLGGAQPRPSQNYITPQPGWCWAEGSEWTGGDWEYSWNFVGGQWVRNARI